MLVDTKKTYDAIALVASLTGAPEVHLEVSAKDGLWVWGAKDGNYFRTLVGAVKDGPKKQESATVVTSYLSAALRGKGESDLVIQENSIFIKNGRTRTELTAVQEAGERPSFDTSAVSSIPDKVQVELGKLLNLVNLTYSVVENNELNQLHFRLNSDGLTLARLDYYHGAYIFAPKLTSKKTIEVALPVTAFSTVTKLAGVHAYKFHFSTASFRAWNDFFQLELPTLQVETQLSLKDYDGIVSTVKSKARYTIDAEEFTSGLDSCAAVIEGAELVTANFDGKTLTMKTKSSAGAVETKVKATGKNSFNTALNAAVISDVVGLLPAGDCVMQLTDALMFFKVKTSDGVEMFLSSSLSGE